MSGKNRGFTLIELIVVIILLGIISVTATSRLIGKSSFTAHIARDQAISIARQIQITAMQASSSQFAQYPLVVKKGSDWESSCFGLITSTSCPSKKELDSSSKLLLGKQTEVQFSPETTVYFNLLGRPVDKVGKRICTSGCQISFTSRNQESASLCINSEGFISEKEVSDACS